MNETFVQILSVLVLALLLIQLAVSLYNFYSKPLLIEKEFIDENDFISILIPARNEEINIKTILSLLSKQKFSNYEVIVLDDDSNDETVARVIEESITNPKIKVIKGENLPFGWLGKNWACYQLAQIAKGKYFLFLDADVLPGENLLSSLLNEIKRKDLVLLSVFPDQIMKTAGEYSIVPLLNFILLSLLPMDFVYKKRQVAFSAAIGQCMFFNGDQYRKFLFHSIVRNKVAEDIEIMKKVKTNNLKGEVLLANGIIRCRMYHNSKEAINGFSKNIFQIFGNNGLLLWLFIMLSIFALIAVVFYGSFALSASVIFLLLLIRITVSSISNQSSLLNIILHPVQMVMLTYIAVYAFISRKKNSVTWKERKI